MTTFTEKGTIVVTCYPYISEYLAQEIKNLGYDEITTAPTSVSLTGNLQDCIRLNFHLRTASRVLFNVRTFPAKNLDQLYDGIFSLPWERHIEADGYFSVTSSANHPDVRNTMFLNMRVKDAIADRFTRNFGNRPDSGGSKHGFSVHVLWKDEMVTVSIDTSGDSLSKHGYRLHPFKAPLQESLAAAMIFATGWDRKSPFINPMCGSGTLAIEAALMASETPPGMFRNRYAFMSIKGYDEKVFQDLKDKATVKKSENQLPVIIASDRDRSAIEAARNNAAEAGVADLIRFETCEFDMTSLAEGPAIVIMNPPYGSRLGEIGELEELYSRIGEFLKKKCTGKLGFVLTSEKSLAAKIGLKASRRIPFINADIECRLLQYEMYGGSRKIKKPGEE